MRRREQERALGVNMAVVMVTMTGKCTSAQSGMLTCARVPRFSTARTVRCSERPRGPCSSASTLTAEMHPSPLATCSNRLPVVQPKWYAQQS